MKIANKKGGKIAKVGPLPGVTRGITGFKICETPPTFVIDSPGIFVPKINKEDNELGLKLSLVGAIKDSLVGVDIIADFLLYTLNKHNETKYVSLFGLDSPTDNINFLLTWIAEKIGSKLKDGQYNLENAAIYFIEKFRKGLLGNLTIDNLDIINSV